MSEKRLEATDPCIADVVSNGNETVISHGVGFPMVNNSITHLDVRQKAFQFQPAATVAAPVGTKKGTIITKFNAANLFNPFMKFWANSHTYIYGSYDVKVINTANTGMSGSMMVGICQEDVASPTEEHLNDNERQIMDITNKGEFQVRVNPIRDAATTDTHMFCGVPLGTYVNYYPSIVLLAFEDFQSTFDNEKLICQFHFYTRFSPGTKFALIGGLAPPKSSLPVFTTNTSFAQILGTDSASLVLDGNYGEKSVGTSMINVRYSGIIGKPKFFSGRTTGNQTHIVTDEALDAFDIKLLQGIGTKSPLTGKGTKTTLASYISTSIEEDDQVLAPFPASFQVGEIEIQNMGISQPDLVGPYMVVPECQVLFEYSTAVPKSVINFKNSSSAQITARFQAEDMNARIAIGYGLAAMVGADVPKATHELTLTCAITFNAKGEIVKLTTNAGQSIYMGYYPISAEMLYRDNVSAAGKPNYDLNFWMGELDLNVVVSDSKLILADPLQKADLIALPNDCLRVVASTKTIPSVNNTVGALPTLIPDLDLVEGLSRFFDPTRVWDLRIVDSTFNQPICDLIYHGPQKLCFMKTLSAGRYFVSKYTSKELLISSANPLTEGSTYPATNLDRTWISRVGTDYKKSLTPVTTKRIEDVVEYQGAALTTVGGGALNGIGQGLGQMSSNNFSKEMFDKNSDLALTLRRLIGEQGMDQLLVSLQGQQDLARLNNQLSLESKGIITPAMQEQLAHGEGGPSGPGNPSTRTDSPMTDSMRDLDLGGPMTDHDSQAFWDYSEVQDALGKTGLVPADDIRTDSSGQPDLTGGIKADPAKSALLEALDAAARKNLQSSSSSKGAIPKDPNYFKSGENLVHDSTFRKATRNDTQRTKLENRNGGYHANVDNQAEIFQNLSPIQQRLMMKHALLPPKTALAKFGGEVPTFSDSDDELSPDPIPFTPLPTRKQTFPSYNSSFPSPFQMKGKSSMDYMPLHNLSDSEEESQA